MTVCIAGITNYPHSVPLIIAACDRKVSFAGGAYSAEGAAQKLSKLGKNWSVMFAGSISPMVPMLEAVKETIEKQKSVYSIRQFARLCSATYRAERIPLIENEILPDYDVGTYAEYLGLKKSEPDLYSAVSERIKREEEGWSLLFAGFDAKKRPHIFVISERGKIEYCDIQGFAVIGSGAYRSSVALSSYEFNRWLSFSKAVFGIAAAKFAAESESDGVGEETDLVILEPNTSKSPVMSGPRVDKLRKLWKGLPRFPKQAEDEVWGGIDEMTLTPGLGRNPFLKAYRDLKKG